MLFLLKRIHQVSEMTLRLLALNLPYTEPEFVIDRTLDGRVFILTAAFLPEVLCSSV